MFLAKLKSVKRVLKHTSEGQNSSSPLPDTDPSGHTVSAQPVLSSATPVAASSTAGCPNKRNPYHQCSEYCEKRWGEKLNAGENSEPELILPPEWTQITDEKIGQPYFCNTQTDAVSWHPPPGSVYENSAASKTPEKVEANENVITLAADATEKSNGYKPRSNSNKKRAGQGKKQRAGKKNFERAGHGGKKKKKKKKLQAWKQSPRAGSIPCRTKKQRLVQLAAGICALALLVVLLVTGPHQLCEVVIVVFWLSLFPMLLPICVLAVALGAAVCTWWFLRCKPSSQNVSNFEKSWSLTANRHGELLVHTSRWHDIEECLLQGRLERQGSQPGGDFTAFVMSWNKQLYLVTAYHMFTGAKAGSEAESRTKEWYEKKSVEIDRSCFDLATYYSYRGGDKQKFTPKDLSINVFYIDLANDLAVAPIKMEMTLRNDRKPNDFCNFRTWENDRYSIGGGKPQYFLDLKERTITILQCLDGEHVRSTGDITNCLITKDLYDFSYAARTKPGSSGAPLIITVSDSKDHRDDHHSNWPMIVGVHNESDDNPSVVENFGSFLFPFLTDISEGTFNKAQVAWPGSYLKITKTP